MTWVTKVPRLKGLLRDRVFSRIHLRPSLTPEEGPSCFYICPLDLQHFLLPKTRKSLRKISTLTLLEVAFYRSVDEWMDTSLARLDSIPILYDSM